MNIIISNKYKDLLNSLDFEISENINGEFTVEEIIQKFSNFFFNKMFLDITAIKDYNNIKNIQKLSINFDMNKIILILDDNMECSSPQFLSQLVSMGIYNFTRNKDGIIYLYNHPNLYRDVAHLQNLGNNNILTPNDVNNNSQYVNHVNTTIIGIKNLTTHAGATTLTYLLKKALSNYYNVMAIEVNKRDFMYYKEPDMISVTAVELKKAISSNMNYSVILIDLNDCDYSLCTDTLFLLEPSLIKLNKLVMLNKNVFANYSNKKILLNKCLLDKHEIGEFEMEAGIKVFYNIPPINDRDNNNEVILNLINKLGLIKKI